MKYQIVDKYVSINGEGPRAGELAIFLRFFGCNLCCNYCDTRWASEPGATITIMSTEDILQYVTSESVNNITLTGGEPLLQPGISELITELEARGYRVEIETNGAVPLQDFSELPHRPAFTMDYKLPGSGMEENMCLENFSLLRGKDAVKFVISNRDDLDKMKEIVYDYSLLSKCKVYLSAAFGRITLAEIAEYMKENRLNGVRLQLQLHKYIWNSDERSV